jgi:hypothetical protein
MISLFLPSLLFPPPASVLLVFGGYAFIPCIYAFLPSFFLSLCHICLSLSPPPPPPAAALSLPPTS